MGALHSGHLSLVRRAAAENHSVIVSVYVNPTQFGINEDLNKYPKTWESDEQKLNLLNEELGREERLGKIESVFLPSTRDMYPTLPPTSEIDGHGSFVHISPLASMLEGASRPVFFRGVATVCMKLFNIVQPHAVYFGQKDIQQTVIIKRMVRDFHIPTKVYICPTEREPDGLAMSSRNVYLGTRRRTIAPVLITALMEMKIQFDAGVTLRKRLLQRAHNVLAKVQKEQESLLPSERARFTWDYISIADPESMEEVRTVSSRKGAIISGAIKMLPLEEPGEGEDTGSGPGDSPVRLIDNLLLGNAESFVNAESAPTS
ncbi:pantothenate synthase [Loxospora ochrophaea]|nr:pantothenate synthase [Loxospora ochrophaea]